MAETIIPARRAGREPVPEIGKYADINHSLQSCWEAFRELVPQKPSGSLVIVLTQDSMRRMWTDHLVRWAYYYDPARLEGISQRLMRGRRLTRPQLEYLRNLKNFGDDLRTFFQFFAVNHHVPKPIQSLVKMVGQLRDQVRLGELEQASRQARELLELLPRAGKNRWPALRVDPLARGAFLSERIAGMQRLLARKKLTAFDFHQFKKDFRLVYSVYYCLYPKEARLPAERNPFAAAKKIIKKMHQVLLQRKYTDQLKFRTTLINLPDQFRARLLRFLGTIKITTPSATA